MLGLGLSLWDSALRGRAPVNPVQTNIAAWFKYGVGITSSGGLVSAWADQSGNSRNLLQATGTNQPTLVGDNSIRFDGTDNFLRTAPFTLNQPTTIYLLTQQITWTAGDRWCDGVTVASGIVAQLTSSPSFTAHAGANLGLIGTLSLSTYGVIACVFNGASSSVRHNTNAATIGNAGTNNMGGITLGCDGAGNQPGRTDFKEYIAYAAAHDNATQLAVIAYLGAAGGISV